MSMRNIYFRRPITILTEKDEDYMIPESFIIFGRTPWLMQNRELSEDEAREKGYSVEVVTVQYRYKLRIDLWFVVFDFGWLGRNVLLDNN